MGTAAAERERETAAERITLARASHRTRLSSIRWVCAHRVPLGECNECTGGPTAHVSTS
jgi:hypothetical protein